MLSVFIPKPRISDSTEKEGKISSLFFYWSSRLQLKIVFSPTGFIYFIRFFAFSFNFPSIGLANAIIAN